MKTLDEKVLELVVLNGEGEDSFIYTEFYSHANKITFKINNTFTRYNKDIHVLCNIDEGFEHAVDLALEQIEKKKAVFFGYAEEGEEPKCTCKDGEPYNNACCDVHGKMEKL